jgi:hypothetical protein
MISTDLSPFQIGAAEERVSDATQAKADKPVNRTSVTPPEERTVQNSIVKKNAKERRSDRQTPFLASALNDFSVVQ